MEPKLGVLFFALLASYKDGAVLDAGANNGADSVAIARKVANRTVYAVEPMLSNLAQVWRRARGFPNLNVIAGALGDAHGQGSYSAHADEHRGWPYGQIGLLPDYSRINTSGPRVNYTIYTIDDVFADQSVAMMHLDMEGYELAALKGGTKVIARDRPILTVETFPKYRPEAHSLLMQYMQTIGYETHIIPERCGSHGCRNVLCLPSPVPEGIAATVARLSSYLEPRSALSMG